MATWPAKINYATGDVLTAAQMNDIGGELNDLYTASGAAAGKNAIINGDFGIWQRGTSFTLSASTRTYTADRFNCVYIGSSQVTTVTQQSFTAGTAPVSGYEGQYFLRYAVTGTTTGNIANQIRQSVEDVRTFAGQTVTFSFWAKADTTRALTVYFGQIFGTGGSADVYTSNNTINITTSWARYSVTVAIPSIAGKTIGTGSFLAATMDLPTATTQTIDTWGWQVEAGSVATPFQTATGTKQGELAACQRYYLQNATGIADFANGCATSTTVGKFNLQLPTQMRVSPTGIVTQNLTVSKASTGGTATGGTWAISYSTPLTVELQYTHGSGVFTAGDTLIVYGNNANSYYGWSAEL